MIIRVRLRDTPSSWVRRQRCTRHLPYARRCGASHMPRGPFAVSLMCCIRNMCRGTYSIICAHPHYVALWLYKLSYQGRACAGGHITLRGIAMATSSDVSPRLMSVSGHPSESAVRGTSSSSAASFMWIWHVVTPSLQRILEKGYKVMTTLGGHALMCLVCTRHVFFLKQIERRRHIMWMGTYRRSWQ